MQCSRREFGLSLPALVASRAVPAEKPALSSKAYRFEDLPVHGAGENHSRPIVSGETHTGFSIELHETELAPGSMPHAPHHHEHEEVFLVREGTLEVTMAGEISRIGPGSAAYIASNVEHGIRNAGTDRAQYFVMALGQDKA